MDSGEILEKLFKEAIDEVINGFIEKQGEYIFKSQHERAKLFFPLLNKQNRNWKQSKKCIYRGCNQKSVNKSHTLTKNVFLSAIAEKGKVCTPQPDFKTGKPKICKVGISEASTFPGFCSKHEALFHVFERNKKIETSSEHLKQTYRTICREVVIKQFRLDAHKSFLETYLRYRDKKLSERLEEQPFMKFLQEKGFQFGEFSFEGKDYLKFYLNKEIDNIENDLQGFKDIFYDNIHNELEDQNENGIFWGCSLHISKHIPVALSGRANFLVYDEVKNENIRVEIIVNVLPVTDDTIVTLFTLKENEDYVKMYLEEYLVKDFGILNMIETWMIYGTDHWFIQSSIWEQITDKNKEAIVADLANFQCNIGTPYNKTIFNDLKRGNLEEIRIKKGNEFFKSFLTEEEKKFTDQD